MNDSQKIVCSDCNLYEDCPRMKGINYCQGRKIWLKEQKQKNMNNDGKKEN